MSLRIESLFSPLAGPFDLTAHKGECVAITGASGSGKSLFLRMVADLDPNEGSIRLDDRRRASFAAPAWRRCVIYVAAESGWWADSVDAHFERSQLAEAKELAARLDLKLDLFSGPVARLSTGERQRLALLRALLLKPAVLLLDEPTGSLDHDSVGRVEAVLGERLAAGLILILVTHDPAQAKRLGGQRFEMIAGKLSPS
jgi:putative ABC transport system ATP-binding protein